MTIYTYSYGITSSFPNQIYAESSLYSEVQNSAITSGIHSIDVDFTYVYFNFKTALSPAEISILDNVVATHTGAELAPQIIVDQGVSGSVPWNIRLIQTQTTQSITGTINVGNFPSTQAVSVSNPVSSVMVSNLPGTQTISPQTGSVFTVTGNLGAIVPFPLTQSVQLVSGSSAISQGNPLWVTGSVISLPTGVQQVNGTLTVAPQTGSSFTVSVSNPINSVLVSNFPGVQTIAPQTGSVFTVTGAVATTVTLPATQSVQIVSSLVTQSIQGTVSIGNFPSTQTVSVSNPVIVNQGEPGSSPWLITGSITTVQQSGTTAVTIDSNYETYSALALSVAVSLNKSMFSILNNSASRIIKISSIKIINSQITTVNGVICQFQILRIGGHSAGTVIIPQTFDTNDVLDNNVTVRTGATISGEAATPLLRYYWSGDEWGAASSKIEGTDHSSQTINSIYSRKINEKPITLRTGEGLTVKQLTNTAIGTFDIEIIFTEE